MIADFSGEIYELKGEILVAEDAARAAHVKNSSDLDLAEKRGGMLLISRELMDNAIKKLKRGNGSPDGCIAEV